MGNAKRRKLLGIQSQSELSLKQIEQVPQLWSIAYTLGSGKLVNVSLYQGEPDALKSVFLQTTGRPEAELKRIDKQGLLAVATPGQLEQLALLRPDAVHTYLKSVLRTCSLRQFNFELAVTPGIESAELTDALRVHWTSDTHQNHTLRVS